MKEQNVYKTPHAELIAEDHSTAQFYVVSPKKFLSLIIATLGLYNLYWFYKNWSQQKDATQSDIWPVMRSIFSIFFTHSLFRSIDAHIKKQNINYKWEHEFIATAYVFSAVATSFNDIISSNNTNSPLANILGIVLSCIIIVSLYKAQIAINIASNDPKGLSNSHFSAANIAWIIFGAALWGLFFIGLFSEA